MVENFSWVTDKKDNFKEYVLNLADSDVEKFLVISLLVGTTLLQVIEDL
jgi:hypothetical protein